MPKQYDISYSKTVEEKREIIFPTAGDVLELADLAPGNTPNLYYLPIDGFNSGQLEKIDWDHRSSERFRNLYFKNRAQFVVIQAGNIDPLPKGHYRSEGEIYSLAMLPLITGGEAVDEDGPLTVAHMYGEGWHASEVGKVWTQELSSQNTKPLVVKYSNTDLLDQVGTNLGPEHESQNDRREAYMTSMMRAALQVAERKTEQLEGDIKEQIPSSARTTKILALKYGFSDFSGNEVKHHLREIEEHRRKMELAYQGLMMALERNTDIVTRGRRDRGRSLIAPVA